MIQAHNLKLGFWINIIGPEEQTSLLAVMTGSP